MTTVECISSGDQDDINAALVGAGAVAVLCPYAVFELTRPVEFTAPDQQIYTLGSPTDDSRALLRVAHPYLVTAVRGNQDGIRLAHLIVDGARPTWGVGEGGLLEMGGDVTGQVVEWVKAYEPRGWSHIVMGHGDMLSCSSMTVRHNELGPGGRAEYGLADGISMACRDSVVADNTITDVTDGGIVIFGSPGSVVENNTIRAVDRPLMYGIAMGDYGPFDGDFTGTTVRSNTIDAVGAVVAVGINMGGATGCVKADTVEINRGGTVVDNLLTGGLMGYGFVASGVAGWTATGNVDLSRHVGHPLPGSGCSGEDVSDPAGFIRSEFTAGTFQEEFEYGVLTFLLAVFTPPTVVDVDCAEALVGPEVVYGLRTAAPTDPLLVLELSPGGSRIGTCVHEYFPPEVEEKPADKALGVDFGLLMGVEPCPGRCAEVEIWNLDGEVVDLTGAEFHMNSFPVVCTGLPDAVGPGDRVRCAVSEFIADGFNVLEWYGLPFAVQPGWGFDFPFEG